MEYVGRRVGKEFPGNGIFFGTVEEFMNDTGRFKIIYDDGGCEELYVWDLLPVLMSSEAAPPPAPQKTSRKRAGRKGKKTRRHIANRDKGDDDSVTVSGVSGSLVDRSGRVEEVGLNIDEGVGMSDGGDHGSNLGGDLRGLDLNEGVKMDLDEGLDLNEGINEENSGKKNKMIDLNLDINEEIQDVRTEKRVRWFDLNVEFKGDEDDDLFDIEENHAVKVDGEKGNVLLNVENKEKIQVENCLNGVVHEKEAPVMEMGRGREEIPDKRISDSVDCDVGATGGVFKGRNRIESLDNNITLGIQESGSSASSCREKMDSFSSQDFALNAIGVNNHLSPTTIRAVTVERNTVSGHERIEETLVLPPKVDLPPSSGDVDLSGVSAFDVVSVYAFLRSFSTLLYLSPFELDDFVTSVKCDDSTLLFDSIHVSLLKTLRLRLVFLSKEGSRSATNCLRFLNWHFLDLITWPVFLVEYLLFHSPGYIPGLELCQFEAFQSDYYKMPVSAKIKILQHLCDEVIEMEVFRSELNTRTLPTECQDNIKRGQAVMDIVSTSSITEEDVDEPTDLNGDECFLCKNDGNLICCDGCPAAFHSRCVGVVTSLLPEGDWYCPECAFDKDKPWPKVGKPIRGAELLETDLHGRQYYSACGYLLLLESCDDGYSSWLYNRNDLPAVVEALASSWHLYGYIITAICIHWNITHGVSGHGPASSNIGSEGIMPDVPRRAHYVNLYEFARTASLILEELTAKSSDKSSEGAARSVEEITAGEMKVKSKKFAEFFWSNVQNTNLNSRKEKCGWCLYCKVPEDEKDCIFVMNDSTPAVEKFTSEILGIKSAKSRKRHLIDVICHVICIEDRLQGLLLGPWLNPRYSELWRKSVLEGSDLGLLKTSLLQLESNLHHLALSAAWRKHVDSVAAKGSASHIVKNTSRVSLNHATEGKKGKRSKMKVTPSSKVQAGLRLFWWRGGKASRELFNCKVLPWSLASKAGRQGGFMKVLGVHYPDSGEYAKRMRYVAWRAAVETSRSVEELALQVRELDANIRWNHIGNHCIISKMDNESKKKSFKNVTIRKKCCEGKVVKYLLDFGKKRSIPDVVMKHGSLLQDSSREKKKYWVPEGHVPLHLLKAFEERRIARKRDKITSGELCESSTVKRKPLKKKGFVYLFSRAERSETYQCGHCNKDVLIRKAVSCQYCKGFFHKRHARKSAGSSRKSVYTCYKCEDDEPLQTGATDLPKRKKALKAFPEEKLGKQKQSADSKKKRGVPLVVPRHKAESVLNLPSLNTKGSKQKRGRPAKPRKVELNKLFEGIRKKKRAPRRSSYWLNGVRFSRKENDERLAQFRQKMLRVPSGENTLISNEPSCSLCSEMKYTSTLNYVACEICGVWLHLDALDLGAGKIRDIIGFKCHNCLKKRPPVCPHRVDAGSNNGLLPWGGKITAESMKIFSPIVIWTKIPMSQQKHHALHFAFKEYLKSWLELMDHASEETDVSQIMVNRESQHRYLPWRAEKDPGHQVLRRLVGETLTSKTFRGYFPEYKCADGTVNKKRSMIGKSFETRPWDATGEITGNSLR